MSSVLAGQVIVETRATGAGRSGDNNLGVVVRGRVIDVGVDAGRLRYLAAAPPDRRGSFSGSGLPFASSAQAFFNSPNQGQAEVRTDGTFEIRLARHPNSYYSGIGTVLVPPCVHVAYKCRGRPYRAVVQIEDAAVPFRLLTYPSGRSGPMFYHVPEQPARTQEAILRSTAFPEDNVQPADFWHRNYADPTLIARVTAVPSIL